jgi:hypothetical protein
MAEDDDVQTAVSLILVLGDRIRHMLNESAVEHWILAYIDVSVYELIIFLFVYFFLIPVTYYSFIIDSPLADVVYAILRPW